LLHDLANHLTLLTLELEDMRSKKHTEALNRSHRIVGQLDAMVGAVRDRLNGQVADRPFNIVDVVQDVVDSTLYKQKLPGLKIKWANPPHAGEWILYGDPIKCYQAISIVVGNAADAYRSKKTGKQADPVIIVGLERHPKDIIIKVTDFGVGISPGDREKVFKPNFTTKETGMGVGLYLARQMISTQFSGKITLSPGQGKTEFVITLPLGKNTVQAELKGRDQGTDDI
jgi:signal transduction histidine kinase